MKDIYLKSPNKECLIVDLDALDLGFVITNDDKVAELSKTDNGFALDYIGKIVDQPGTYDEEGKELTKVTFFDGVHANLRVFGDEEKELLETLENAVFESGTQVIEAPSTPYRVWA